MASTYDLFFTKDREFAARIRSLDDPSAVKVVLTVIRQQPEAQFIVAFMSVFVTTDWTGAANIVAHRDRGVIEMDGQETYRHAVARLTEASREALAAAGIALDDVDLFVPHQANARITRAVGARLGLPAERVVDCIAELGNTSAATLPLALAQAESAGRLQAGDTVLLAAFGAGFTWGAAVLEWGRPA